MTRKYEMKPPPSTETLAVWDTAEDILKDLSYIAPEDIPMRMAKVVLRIEMLLRKLEKSK